MNNPTHKDQVSPLRTQHGEIVYEMIGSTAEHGGVKQHSLAHIVIPTGKASLEHYHKISEETYYILRGSARMVLGGQVFSAAPSQVILIKPGQRHQIFNAGEEDLEFLAICAPAWRPEDSYNN